ncbi:hypothetical protein Fmac_006879 [Flemingia macrophylla]|uniref:Uncharacterized protein n=1 Tax=Flemingia macrophylla TaxID=520843 RepID=A0ABD1NBV3_9FABA
MFRFTPSSCRARLTDTTHRFDSPRVGAVLVPEGRETDWIVSTELDHLQLLFTSPQISRLILIETTSRKKLSPHVCITVPQNVPSTNRVSTCGQKALSP